MGISGPPEKGKTPLGTEEKEKRFYPILGVFSPLYWEKLRKGITKVITTTGISKKIETCHSNFLLGVTCFPPGL